MRNDTNAKIPKIKKTIEKLKIQILHNLKNQRNFRYLFIYNYKIKNKIYINNNIIINNIYLYIILYIIYLMFYEKIINK